MSNTHSWANYNYYVYKWGRSTRGDHDSITVVHSKTPASVLTHVKGMQKTDGKLAAL